MEYTYRQMQRLFMQQSNLDAWEDFERSINKTNFLKWDYVIITASNETQADVYRQQIEARLKNKQLPLFSHYTVLPDPEGKRVGSGGATFNVLRYIAEREGNTEPFKNKRILVIHSGGDSKRVPQYSGIGKLFSPVPRELPNGRCSSVFDELMIAMAGVPSRIRDGMLVLSGDVMLLFNPLQIDDAMVRGAAALSIKDTTDVGKDHGVYLKNDDGYVGRFLHKQSVENLQKIGAVDDSGHVDLDTGAVIFDSGLLMAFYSLISTDGQFDQDKFNKFVSEEARVSFYGDFLYPLAADSDEESYYKEAAEGEINDALTYCRGEIWKVVHDYSMKLIRLSPAEFIHFGTTRELRALMTEELPDYEFLGWKRKVLSTGLEKNDDFAAHNSYFGHLAEVGKDAYIEDSYILGNSKVGAGAVISNIYARDVQFPEDTVWHGLKQKDGSFVVRVYGVNDNPKGGLADDAEFLNTTLGALISQNKLETSDLWNGEDECIWFAKIYPACETNDEALKMAGIVCRMASGTASEEEIALWRSSNRESLYSSFNKADMKYAFDFASELESRILANKFVYQLSSGVYCKEALKVFGKRGITEHIYRELQKDAQSCSEEIKIRIYYAVSRWMKENRKTLAGSRYDVVESKCFDRIMEMIYEDAVKRLPDNSDAKISEDCVDIELPVRVNWGGGWTDTPPQCNELGGAVLNAAIKLNGICPVKVTVKRADELHIEFESQDIGVKGTAETVEEVLDCNNPYDSFALHKAALIACGIVPRNASADLKQILQSLGGGLYISTQVIGVPKGSGLGTSSILSAACVKAIYQFIGKDVSDDEISEIVLLMEQMMSTGGGWQDQVGGLTPGIKFTRSTPGIHQNLHVEHIELDKKTQQELQERFALVYTGQRRLARNLLRDVVGNYIGARPESIDALKQMAPMAALMKFELERGDIDAFAELLDKHWELSKQLDAGCTNTCIDQIFMVCEDLICARFIAGAGGGGFIQMVLKKGVTKAMLQKRIHEVFQDSGVMVWDCEIVF